MVQVTLSPLPTRTEPFRAFVLTAPVPSQLQAPFVYPFTVPSMSDLVPALRLVIALLVYVVVDPATARATTVSGRALVVMPKSPPALPPPLALTIFLTIVSDAA